MSEEKQKSHFSKLYDEMDKSTVKMTDQFGEDLVWALRKNYDDLVHLTPGSLGEKMVLSAMTEYAQQEAVEFSKWYSGMDKKKVKAAYLRYKTEKK